ncbi:MAG: ferredoxin [Bacteroidetes bacterium]|nr:ferredoxin [Bacteroidota bacterium]
MAIQFENEIRQTTVQEVANLMLTAARTAPKGRGRDTLILGKISGEDLKILAKKMNEMAEGDGLKFYARDAKNILNSEVVIILATRIEPLGMNNCGNCGFDTCTDKLAFKDAPCAFNSIDLGIAAGAAVSIAADHRIDNRIMFSAGQAVKELNFLGEEVGPTLCIPLSVSSKSPYFDR